MDITSFKDLLKETTPPIGLTVQLEALWYDGKGDWDHAHDLIDDLDDKQSAHVHAYLHRKEGDLWNADYWYRRAGRQRPSATLEEEWEELVRILL
ncbi:hypothetical protein GCM10007415_21950 [Parapedobacter pyrenivorans]|uniref:Uncharacterized protein n=1 Tax=Parapedobacter pyrenivorans TaxID=1305674 RepID=A0A917HSB5_9SPHI|nr:hypothetical protein [Parapedobacter pyrenivorans]GGG87698.1 hypothetical protein GCM10007415_21950 [Parapedobacter pyrenivorans]